MNLDEIYTPLGEAKKEIERRWADKNLRKKIEDVLGFQFPIIFKNEPRAILARGILTPNHETAYFLDIASLIDLKPVCGEFHKDKFCTMNKDKIHLGKLVFSHKSKKTGHDIISKKTIIDLQRHENKAFKEIKTIEGTSLIEFHHRFFISQYKELLDCFDISVFKENGESAIEVYEKIFSLCITHGILFENFIDKETEHEKKFTNNVVIPAFKKIYEKYGLKPLIVPLLPLKNEERDLWDWYPGHLEEKVEDLFRNSV